VVEYYPCMNRMSQAAALALEKRQAPLEVGSNEVAQELAVVIRARAGIKL